MKLMRDVVRKGAGLETIHVSGYPTGSAVRGLLLLSGLAEYAAPAKAILSPNALPRGRVNEFDRLAGPISFVDN